MISNLLLSTAHVLSNARLIILAILSLGPGVTQAQAGTITCNVKITSVGTDPNGTVIPKLEGMGWPYMCNLTTGHATNAGTIAPETCQGWLSMFMTAVATQQSMVFYFNYGAAPAPADCASFTNFSWQVPAVFPYFMSLEKPQ
ncbi:hypothetical protein SAMN02745824_3371 [Parasphingorhabdus marina DSM 22363]|uniref:Uncharacterized protein n=1 Tax=Parasphingorhabdus marina DSM 22363 TaxID=1123272 RepID=A0A1N6HMZ3_9SPHN|nr:hypothetical protein [Parasphingorhabdus marina]SIO21204.1 hypothetical protein SAMN02745824_3371 [Parasphingorhabdus marina DSM 22363]